MPNMDSQPYYNKQEYGKAGVGKPMYGDRHPSEPASEHYPAPNKGMLSEIFGGTPVPKCSKCDDLSYELLRAHRDLEDLRAAHALLKTRVAELQMALAVEKDKKASAVIHNHYHYDQPVPVVNPPAFKPWPINPHWNQTTLW